MSEVTTIPANPGFAVLLMWPNALVVETPILAWRIHKNKVAPITIDGHSTANCASRDQITTAIKLPDGRVFDGWWGAIHESVQAWVDAVEQDAADDVAAEREAERAEPANA